MEIDGGGDSIVATSLLDASNLIVLKVRYCLIFYYFFLFCSLSSVCITIGILLICFQGSSVIHSNANLGVRGQGLLNLSGDGDTIEAQRLILSLFYSIQV